MRKILFLLFPFVALISDETDPFFPTSPQPWFTGTLLTTSGLTTPAGHFNFQPYIFVNNNVGYYNNHWQIHRFPEPRTSVFFQLYAWAGVTKFMDIFIVPQALYNYEGDVDSWKIGDPTIGLDFLLYSTPKGALGPVLKFTISELFPVGKYQKLSAKKLSTDIGGGGTFVTTLELVFQEIWAFTFPHFLSLRLNPYVLLFTPVKVHGINTYGGDPSTRGKVYPGTAFDFILGLEYSFTRHWAGALDIASFYALRTRFHGRTIAPVGNQGYSYQLSLAPAIEYNHNANLGLIGGLWFTVLGKNSFDFFNGVISITWYM